MRPSETMGTCELPWPQCQPGWVERIHSTGTLLAQLQLPLQRLVPVSSGWSPFFIVDPSSLFRKWFSCLDVWGAPGKTCYKYRVWPHSSVHRITMIWGEFKYLNCDCKWEKLLRREWHHEYKGSPETTISSPPKCCCKTVMGRRESSK